MRLHAFITSLILTLHLWIAFQARFPRGLYDELVYLGFGRLFAGAADMPNIGRGGLGHFGYSIFVAPVFAIVEGFPAQYRGVLVLNSIFLTSIYASAYFLVRRLFPVSREAATAVAALTCLYPTYLLYAGFAISDAIYAPWFMLLLVLLHRYLESPGWPACLALGFVAGVSYSIHARSVSVILCLWALLLLLAFRRKLPWPHAAILVLLPVAAWLITEQAKQALVALAGAPYPSGSLRLADAFRLGLTPIVPGFAGELFYLSAASFILYPLGLGALGAIVWRRDQNHDPRRLTAGFALATHLAVMLGSVIYMIPEWTRGASGKILDGRYNEGTTPLILAAGGASIWLAGRSTYWRRIAWGSFFGGVLLAGYSGLFVSPYFPAHLINTDIRFGMASLVPLAEFTSPATYGKIALFAVAVALSCLLLTRISPTAAIALMASIFLGMTWLAQRHFLTVQDLLGRGINHEIVAVGGHLPSGSRIAYDLGSWHPFLFSYYQLMLPDKTFVTFDSSRGGTPAPAAMVIASSTWRSKDLRYHVLQCRSLGRAENCAWLPSGSK